MRDMESILDEMIERKATDLHITVGIPVQFRISKKLVSLDSTVITPELARELIYSLLSPEKKKKFEQEHELDFSLGRGSTARFRGNVFISKENIACAIRYLPAKIPSLHELGLPNITKDIIKKSKGLVLVTGATGSGKSTTLASMVQRINEDRACHIITIEDPIEYVFPHKRSIVHQREIGRDTKSFSHALKYCLREDPDVIFLGEMRDIETMRFALTAAETGHLLLSTLHTNSAAGSIERIIDVFPSTQHKQVRAQLALTLEGIFAHTLLPGAKGGIVLAVEVLIATPAVRAIIRDGREHEMYGVIQTGQKYGMQTFNMSLAKLVKSGKVNRSVALSYATNPDELLKILDGK
ncbi:PilT/PilU family type 4a pilus ATPase [candidate division WOR-3 bacterium]|nr:PilT/PilU family type 4a pilus ATPase [candidate division WOR-3 bacterium]